MHPDENDDAATPQIILSDSIWQQEPAIELRPILSAHSNASDSEEHRNSLSESEHDDEPLLPQSQSFDVRFASTKLLSPWFPQVDPEHPRAQTWKTWRSRREILLTICCAVSGTVFLVNFVGTIVLEANWKTKNSLGRIFRGDCKTSQRLTVGLHLLINILSTLLFAASNVCMQLLASPTRSEVDKAHRQYRWLDIGVPSIRNLRSIRRDRQVIWFILGISSVPLHFLFNSAIIPTIGTNSYVHLTVDPTFIQGSTWNSTATRDWVSSIKGNNTNGMLSMLDMWNSTYDLDAWIHRMQNNVNNTAEFRKEDPVTCLLQYVDLFGNRSDVIFVTSNYSITNNSLFAYGMSGSEDPWKTGWYLGLGNSFDSTLLDLANFPGGAAERAQKISNWTIVGQKVDYCLSSQVSTSNMCSIEYSLTIMIIVCVCNFVKFACIAFTTWRYWRHKDPPLSILGDALCSFLEQPDPTTAGVGILSLEMIQSKSQPWKKREQIRWKIHPTRWFFAASWRRWALCLTLSIGLLIGASVEFFEGMKFFEVSIGSIPSLSYVLKMGFGSVNLRSISDFVTRSPATSTIYKNVIFDNSWQFMISFIYLLVNSLVSTFFVSDELVGYAKERKTLRVSAPIGIQRSSYFVSMPARYGIPLIATIGLLHWTVSQSLFVICIDRYLSNGDEQAEQRYVTSGFSLVAALTSMIIGIVLLIALLALSARKYSGEMPLASTCSAALSALCHPPEEDTEVSRFPVMWGEISRDAKGVGHCAFTTAVDVKVPEEGCIYE